VDHSDITPKVCESIVQHSLLTLPHPNLFEVITIYRNPQIPEDVKPALTCLNDEGRVLKLKVFAPLPDLPLVTRPIQVQKVHIGMINVIISLRSPAPALFKSRNTKKLAYIEKIDPFL
jgi:hypothetical protein